MHSFFFPLCLFESNIQRFDFDSVLLTLKAFEIWPPEIDAKSQMTQRDAKIPQ